MKKSLIGALLALFAPVDTGAQPVSDVSGPDTYLQLHVGALVPQSSDLDGIDTGYAFGGAFGARFSPMVSVEGGVGFARATGAKNGIRRTLVDVPFTVSLRLRLPFERGEISGLVGADLHSTRLTNEVLLLDVTDRATSFGWHVGVGAGFQLSPTIVVGAEVRRSFATAPFDGGDVDIGTLRFAATVAYQF
jgi:opacity protein-like surface antigen